MRDHMVQMHYATMLAGAQGYSVPSFTLNLGWRHKVNDRISITATAQDVFNTSRFGRVLDTPILKEDFEGRFVSRALIVRLDYKFGGGGKGAREPGFEYDNPAPATP